MVVALSDLADLEDAVDAVEAADTVDAFESFRLFARGSDSCTSIAVAIGDDGFDVGRLRSISSTQRTRLSGTLLALEFCLTFVGVAVSSGGGPSLRPRW